MSNETLKLELIEWLTNLNDFETLKYLKIVKDAKLTHSDWWDDLTIEQRFGIQKGLDDIDEGRIISHDDVVRKYGL